MEMNMGQGRLALPFSTGYVLARPRIVCVGLYVNGHDIYFFFSFFIVFQVRMHDNQFYFSTCFEFDVRSSFGSKPNHFRLGRCELVIVLRLGIIEQLGSLLVALLSLRIFLDLLQVGCICKATLLGDSETALCAGAGHASVQPSHDVGEQLVNVDARQNGDIGPSKQRYVGDGILSTARTSDVVTVSEARVEDAVETLRLAYVSLDTIGNLFLGEAKEVVRLTLPRYIRREED